MNQIYGYSNLSQDDYELKQYMTENYLLNDSYSSVLGFLFNEFIPAYSILSDNKDEELDYIISNKIITDLKNITFEEILKYVDDQEIILDISEIPLFNTYENAADPTINWVKQHHFTNYKELGGYFSGNLCSTDAKEKCGEGYAKISSQLGFTILFMTSPRTIECTPLGLEYIKLPTNVKKDIFQKLSFKVPAVQLIFKYAKNNNINIKQVLRLQNIKETTVNRRTSSIGAIIKSLNKCSNLEIMNRCANISW